MDADYGFFNTLTELFLYNANDFLHYEWIKMKQLG